MNKIKNDLLFNNDCISFLCSLPKDIDPKFSEFISDYVNSHDNQESMLLYILNNSKNIELRFNAFYTLMIIYRRNKNVSKSKILCQKYKLEFDNRPLFLYQMSSIYKNDLTYSSLCLALEYARKSIQKIELSNTNYPGFYNNFSEIVAISFENTIITDNSVLDEAISSINKAIMINPNYAKYYFTLGRLLIIYKDFNEAKNNLMKAIDLEDSSRKDYQMRISEYQDVLMKCSLSISISKLEDSLNKYESSRKKLKKELDEMRNSIIEFIGFFAAIIALIITTVQISTNFNFTDAIKLIGFMIGGIIAAFSSLRIILNFSKKSILQMIIMCVLGIIFIIFSFILIEKL